MRMRYQSSRLTKFKIRQYVFLSDSPNLNLANFPVIQYFLGNVL